MTPTRMRECLALMHWTQRGFARVVGCSEGTVRQWARGRLDVPAPIAQWLEQTAHYMEENPAPARTPVQTS
ncbi:helix-turn-helix domain-containing protein [Saccharibacter floricola]|uniref:excisionase n=1 Tax=Saccharibacter floricola TaxID=231053 RepID=UPI00037928C8|nr:excisionase [Saccharibacter floricola]